MKKVLLIFICLILVSSSLSYAYAYDYGQKDAILRSTTTFTISSSGLATVKNVCVCQANQTSGISISTKIQKKTGLIWINVSGASWTDTTSSYSITKTHSKQLSSSGTYRAHVVFTIYKTDGTTETITRNVQDAY